MYRATASAAQFMARTGIHSTKGSRRGFVDVETGISPASLESPSQRKDSIARSIAAKVDMRRAIKAGKVPGGKVVWQRLGQEIQDLQREASALPHGERMSFTAAFFHVCEQKLSPATYESLMREAQALSGRIDCEQLLRIKPLPQPPTAPKENGNG